MASVDWGRFALHTLTLVLSILTFCDVVYIIRHRTNGARLWKIPIAIVSGVNIIIMLAMMVFEFERFVPVNVINYISSIQRIFMVASIFLLEHYKKLALRDKQRIL